MPVKTGYEFISDKKSRFFNFIPVSHSHRTTISVTISNYYLSKKMAEIDSI